MTFVMILVLLVSSIGVSHENSLEKYTKENAKEDQKWTTNQTQELLKKGIGCSFESDDILPNEDKGKQFDEKTVASGDLVLKRPEKVQEIEDLNQKRPKTNLEGTEPVFHMARSVFENPAMSVGIESTRTHEIPEEVVIVDCEEAGTYQISFLQKRKVEVIPEQKKQVKLCRGHYEFHSEGFWTKSSAEKLVKKRLDELSKDASLESYTASSNKDGALGRYIVVFQWKHKDNTPHCKLFLTEEIVMQPASENETWETDFPDDLVHVEGNPNCKLLYFQVLEGPEVHVVNGKSVFRDIWSRRLFFSCEPRLESPCGKLREQGGVLIKKRCQKENRFGECDLWVKTYDLGKVAAHQEISHSFKEEKIWGLNDIFDSTYEKNKDLIPTVISLSVFSEMEKEMEKVNETSEADIEIFRGERLQCQCSFIKGILYDCCKKMNGLAVATYLAACSSEEQALAQRRHDGQCHHVGSMRENLGTQTSQVFCCFPSKLARIVQEQGRDQLGITWGKADAPVCRGFSIQEIQSIDFTRIDFSDAFEDLSIDKEDLMNKVRDTVENLKSSSLSEAQMNTDLLIQPHKENMKHAQN